MYPDFEGNALLWCIIVLISCCFDKTLLPNNNYTIYVACSNPNFGKQGIDAGFAKVLGCACCHTITMALPALLFFDIKLY